MGERGDKLIRHCISHCPHEWQVDAGMEHACIWYEIAREIRQAEELREALRFYAAEVNYERERGMREASPIELDCGEIARTALPERADE